MVWEKVRAAINTDLDVVETIKDICVVYYHYLLESNESSFGEGQPDSIKGRSVEFMIESVRRRYVVAIKMLSLNNSAKTSRTRVQRASEAISGVPVVENFQKAQISQPVQLVQLTQPTQLAQLPHPNQ